MNMGKALWSGRFDEGMDESTLDFTSSLDADMMLAYYDAMGSIAHARMLKKCKIIPAKDADLIIKGLKDIVAQMEEGEFDIDDSLEDIHTNIETALTQAIGPVGGKLHTGRSRNDQVATDFKMYLRDAALDIIGTIDDLICALVEKAKKYQKVVLPGFTHMQHAQPVTLAQHYLAFAFKLDRDADRFVSALKRMNLCPLGAAALAGTTYKIDREMTAKALAFDAPTNNSMDSVSDRDFVSEIAFCASLTANHLSSMSEELVLWSTSEFGFIEMDDRYSTGSSIMPQKKNSDIAELIRGKTGNVTGSLVSMLMLTKGLPLSYNRDIQEDKKNVMSSLEGLIDSIVMMTNMIDTVKINKDRMMKECETGFINATDLADYLVRKGVPFREAHAIVGQAVRDCIKSGKSLEQLKITEFKKYSALIDDKVYDSIKIDKCVANRKSYGGTSPSSTKVQIDEIMKLVGEREKFVDSKSTLIEECWNKLLE